MIRPTANNRQHGFTLIEVLIAISLMSMIALIGYGSVVFSLKQWDKGERSMHDSAELFNAMLFLRNRMTTMKRTAYQAGNRTYVGFAGSRDSLRFIGKFANAPQAGLYVCVIDREGDVLRLRYGLYHPEGGDFDTMPVDNNQAIVRDVRVLEYRYFGAVEGAQPGWHETWEKMDRLPSLIKYSIRLGNGRTLDNTIYIEAAAG